MLIFCTQLFVLSQAISQEHALLIPVTKSCTSGVSSCSSTTGSLAWSDDSTVNVDHASITKENDIKELLQLLPRNLNKDKIEQNASNVVTASRLDTLKEESENEDFEEGLVVAWQYRQDVQQKRQGFTNLTSSPNRTDASSLHSSLFCHSYDLQGRLDEQMDVLGLTTILPMECCSCFCSNLVTRQHCGFRYYQQLIKQIKSMQEDQPQQVIRLLLHNPEVSALAVALPLVLNHIRTERLPVVVLLTVKPWTMALRISLRQLQRTADIVLETESFVARRNFPPPPEFRHLHGLLKIRKMATLSTVYGVFAHLTVEKRPIAILYGLKRDRRKLHLQLLHIPPEDYAADGGSAGGARSGAGRTSSSSNRIGCGSEESATLDF